MTEPLYERPELYDAVYAGEHHGREVAFVLDALDRHGVDAVSVLDVGAGTGGHARRLAERGLEVTAVEPATAMRERARERCGDLDGIEVVGGRLPDLAHVDRRHDAVLALHSVLNYLGPDELEAGVRALADAVADGGLLVLDNSSLPPADEGNAVDYAVGETTGGRYVRVARMRPLGDRLEWVQVVFPPDGAVLRDRHRLTPFDDPRVGEALRAAGLAVERHDGYGDDEGQTDGRTVFVGRG